MYGALVAFCKWLEGTPWGVSTRTSLWLYPFIQLIHFSGLTVWLGTNIAVDLRLLAKMFRQVMRGGEIVQLLKRLE